jgi:hypothetical protein
MAEMRPKAAVKKISRVCKVHCGIRATEKTSHVAIHQPIVPSHEVFVRAL